MGYAGTALYAGAALREFPAAVFAAAPGPAPRGVPSTAYLWIPVAVGAGLAVLLVLVAGIAGVPYADDQEEPKTARLFRLRFWQARFYASAAWTFADSGATNVAALGTALATILGGSTVLSSLFKIDLIPFIIMNVACGGVIAAAPLLFGIINFFIMRDSPVIPADARLTLAAGAAITLPSGASIAVPGGAAVRHHRTSAGGGRAGSAISVAPGTVITVRPGAVMALPGGATIAICAGATLTLDTGTRIP
ncbi:MAG TPA: hypothetical protein VHF26_26535, partial [Trebonia sp.]|nr:hypothetical protein [Trebonia sp.]